MLTKQKIDDPRIVDCRLMIVDLPARHRTRYNQICEIQALVLRRGGRVALSFCYKINRIPSIVNHQSSINIGIVHKQHAQLLLAEVRTKLDVMLL